MAVKLSEQGHFTWKEWAATLAEELKAAASQALRMGAFASNPYGTPAIRNQADLDRELSDLRASLFDPAFGLLRAFAALDAGAPSLWVGLTGSGSVQP